jgi:hypothetical protein
METRCKCGSTDNEIATFCGSVNRAGRAIAGKKRHFGKFICWSCGFTLEGPLSKSSDEAVDRTGMVLVRFLHLYARRELGDVS